MDEYATTLQKKNEKKEKPVKHGQVGHVFLLVEFWGVAFQNFCFGEVEGLWKE